MRKLYIGGGLSDSHLFYIAHILKGYSRSRNIDVFVIDQKSIRKEVVCYIENLTVEKELSIEFSESPNVIKRALSLCFNLKILAWVFFQALFLTRKNLVKSKSWYQLQIKHALWDIQILKTKPSRLRPLKLSFSWWTAVLLATESIVRAKKLSNENFIAALMGHTVYQYRAFLATMRNELTDLDVLCQANFQVYRLPIGYDENHSAFSRREWKKYTSYYFNDMALNYWDDRLRGLSNSADANLAFNCTGTAENNLDFDGVVMLHIFRDSPFGNIDPDRIFSDYVEWVIETIRIIAFQPKLWAIKVHPSSQRWGDDQKKWLDAIFVSLFGTSKPPSNIRIINGGNNLDLLSRCKKLVTFRGTSQVEFACMGKRPIVISKSTLESFNPFLVKKPVTLEQYRAMLLSEKKCEFLLTEAQVISARRLLFAREVLLSIKQDVEGLTLYRSDSPSLVEQDFISIQSRVPEIREKLEDQGFALGQGWSRTIALRFMAMLD